jgi:hypothetical protein
MRRQVRSQRVIALLAGFALLVSALFVGTLSPETTSTAAALTAPHVSDYSTAQIFWESSQIVDGGPYQDVPFIVGEHLLREDEVSDPHRRVVDQRLIAAFYQAEHVPETSVTAAEVSSFNRAATVINAAFHISPREWTVGTTELIVPIYIESVQRDWLAEPIGFREGARLAPLIAAAGYLATQVHRDPRTAYRDTTLLGLIQFVTSASRAEIAASQSSVANPYGWAISLLNMTLLGSYTGPSSGAPLRLS